MERIVFVNSSRRVGWIWVVRRGQNEQRATVIRLIQVPGTCDVIVRSRGLAWLVSSVVIPVIWVTGIVPRIAVVISRIVVVIPWIVSISISGVLVASVVTTALIVVPISRIVAPVLSAGWESIRNRLHARPRARVS